MKKGNQKSALNQDEKLQKYISQGVRLDYLLPISPEIVEKIPEGYVASLGIVG